MKYIFITGGVVSSLGKGLTSGALGALLETRGLKVRLQKFDPYLNVDPGSMCPFQHGEVYVLNDGAETDLDLGHYERFTNCELRRTNSMSSGQVYERVLQKERSGEYGGDTVQVIPHVTNEIKGRLYEAGDSAEVLITELGGTTGDIEGLPFLEALRQFSLEVGKQNVLFIHITLVPYLKAAGELKTKPSQQSVAKLREIGIMPDILICRTEHPITQDMRQKLSMFCNVETKAVIEEMDVENSIYELPLNLAKEGIDQLIVDKLHLDAKPSDMSKWDDIVRKINYPKHEVKIALVGKYVGLQDAYKSVCESIAHGGIGNDCKVKLLRIDSEIIERDGAEKHLKGIDGILVPGGFGDRGIEGKILAAQYARENKIPFLGIALGMQVMAVEFARNVLKLADANSQEFNVNTNAPIIIPTCDESGIRRGAYPCEILENTKLFDAYKQKEISERHRHYYEFNKAYKAQFETAGMTASGMNKALDLVEVLELKDHPWMLGVQFHPEFKSKPILPHPLVAAFIKSSIK